MLRARRIMLINVHRMLIHAQQAEEGIVEFGDRAARPVPERLSRFQLIEVAAVL
jgi:hypothetical protein